MKRFAIANGTTDTETMLHFAAKCQQVCVHGLGVAAAQTSYEEKSAGRAKTEKHHANEPEFDKGGEQTAGKKARLGTVDYPVRG